MSLLIIRIIIDYRGPYLEVSDKEVIIGFTVAFQDTIEKTFIS